MQLLQDRAGLDRADGGAVLRRLQGDVGGGLVAARAGDVLHYDRRIAGDVLSEMAADEPGVAVKAAAHRRTDGDPHGLAAIEVGDRVLRGRAAGEAECGGENDDVDFHRRPPHRAGGL